MVLRFCMSPFSDHLISVILEQFPLLAFINCWLLLPMLVNILSYTCIAILYFFMPTL